MPLALVTLIVVPLNGYVLTQRWGIFLLLMYVMLTEETASAAEKGGRKGYHRPSVR